MDGVRIADVRTLSKLFSLVRVVMTTTLLYFFSLLIPVEKPREDPRKPSRGENDKSLPELRSGCSSSFSTAGTPEGFMTSLANIFDTSEQIPTTGLGHQPI